MRHNLELRLRVSNMEDTVAFYKAALEPIGMRAVAMRSDGLAVGFGFKRICKARIFLWVIAPGTPLTITSLAAPQCSTDKISRDTSPLLGAQSFDLLEKGDEPEEGGVTRDVHVCIPTFKRASVDKFYERAVAAGGKGLLPAAARPSPYNGRWYYNAVVQDLDGRSVEVACRSPPLVSGKYGWMAKMVKIVFFIFTIMHLYMFMTRFHGKV